MFLRGGSLVARVRAVVGDDEDGSLGSQGLGGAGVDGMKWIVGRQPRPSRPGGLQAACDAAEQLGLGPSEVNLPPSKVAVTFLRLTAGNRNGATVWSDMAGLARRDRVNG